MRELAPCAPLIAYFMRSCSLNSFIVLFAIDQSGQSLFLAYHIVFQLDRAWKYTLIVCTVAWCHVHEWEKEKHSRDTMHQLQGAPVPDQVGQQAYQHVAYGPEVLDGDTYKHPPWWPHHLHNCNNVKFSSIYSLTTVINVYYTMCCDSFEMINTEIICVEIFANG